MKIRRLPLFGKGFLERGANIEPILIKKHFISFQGKYGSREVRKVHGIKVVSRLSTPLYSTFFVTNTTESSTIIYSLKSLNATNSGKFGLNTSFIVCPMMYSLEMEIATFRTSYCWSSSGYDVDWLHGIIYFFLKQITFLETPARRHSQSSVLSSKKKSRHTKNVWLWGQERSLNHDYDATTHASYIQRLSHVSKTILCLRWLQIDFVPKK